MNSSRTQSHDRIKSHQTPRHPFTRGFLEGMAGLFDILGVRARPRKRRTPEDDAGNLNRDLQRIGLDFRTVLSKIESAPPK